MTSARQEILWINTLKGGCILLVVLHHAIITTFAPSLQYLTAGIIPAEGWVTFNKYLSPLRMPAFFFVSGLLAASAISKKSWQEVFTKKFSNILYLYLLWGVIQWLCIHYISTHMMGDRLSTAKNAAYADSPLQFIKLLLLSMTSLWYLYALAGFFLFTKLFHRQKVALVLLAIVANYAAQLSLIPGWGPASVAQNYLYFLLGVFFSERLIVISHLERQHWLLLAGIALIGVAHHVGGSYKNPFYSLLTIVFGIVLCRFLNQRCNMAWLNWIGRNTLQIYVLHRIFIELLGLSALTLALHYGWFGNTTFSWAWALLMPLAGVAVCTSLSLVVWTLLNHGPGRMLFLYPRLLRKQATEAKSSPLS
ncbi:acyltransferase family protein [Pantoea phytobeneficialis]|uniref:Acyltransferase n=1 Tax=Pantoea phytobeneficialis TaxID=2052056 RepID=A0AAP9H7M7_9GAMM|nr:acyltransferase family protein [Pantoea phytobeneficialis]MDO6408890.1 acyltransferase family protein [Pantoea phytobeneficialis]QGR08001.1 acyltransferase [Pantoea phytobeneficialis]